MVDQILIQNSGTVAPNNSTDPTDVADGVIEAFPYDDGGSLDLTGGNSIGDEDFFLVLGRDGEYPLRTPEIPADSVGIERVDKEAYSAAQAQIVTVDVPDSSEDGSMGVKVAFVGDGDQPKKRENYSEYFQSTDTDDTIASKLAQLINDDKNSWLLAGTDRQNTVTVSVADTNTITVNIDGVSYSETNDSASTSDTAADFVSSHQSTIRDRHGVWVTASGSDLTFEDRYTGDEPSISVDDGSDESNNMSETVASKLRLEAEDPGTRKSFDLALFGQEVMVDASTTTVQEPAEGTGLSGQVAESEDRLRSQMFGRVAWDDNILGAQDEVPKFVDSSNDYDLYTITFKNDMDADVISQMEFQTIMIAVATGADATNLENYLGV